MHLPALLNYLQGLRENNDKAWFVMNKPAYDILRDEFVMLVAGVIAQLAKADPHVADVNPKKALFRIYRDIRFSNDKTPYKTHFSASIADGPVKHWGPMYYLSIDWSGRLHVGAGCWLPPKDVLASLRRHAIEDVEGLKKLLRGKKLRETYAGLSDEDRLTRIPKGFDPEDPAVMEAAVFVRNKSFVVSTDVDLTSPEGKAIAKDLPTGIAKLLAAATPLNDWLRRAPVVNATE